MRTRALLGLLLLLALPRPLLAQKVARVSGNRVTLSVGASAGVAVGMTGRVQTTQMVQGKEMPLTVAKFRVVNVTATGAIAEVTAGNAGEIVEGMTARFDQKLVAAASEPAAPRPTAPRAKTAAELKAEGERLYDAKDYERAAERFRELAGRFPNDPNADYARSLAEAAGQKAAEAREKAEAERRVADGRSEADRLAMEARRLLDAGLWAQAKEKAEQALRADATNGAAASAKREAESHLGPPKELTDARTGIKWVLIPSGSFTMGCTAGDGECEGDERPAHRVTISRPFYMAETETTNGQYGRMGSANGSPDHPKVSVSWTEAEAYCRWAGGRLPTEAEWEYAARGGQEGNRYPWGNSISHDEANYDGTGGRDSWTKTSPVKSFAANGFGLYDIAGNVWEWVADWYDEGYYGRSPSTDPTGPSTGSTRVLRGGSWDSLPGWLRVSYRDRTSPDNRGVINGFRCTRDANP